MKNFTLLLIAMFAAITMYAMPGEEEAMYEGHGLSYSVEKISTEVIISMNMIDPTQYEEISVLRSEHPTKFFRPVKNLTADKLADFTGNDAVVDKYPLPSKKASYYKIVTIDNTGVQKTYPSVKLWVR